MFAPAVRGAAGALMVEDRREGPGGAGPMGGGGANRYQMTQTTS